MEPKLRRLVIELRKIMPTSKVRSLCSNLGVLSSIADPTKEDNAKVWEAERKEMKREIMQLTNYVEFWAQRFQQEQEKQDEIEQRVSDTALHWMAKAALCKGGLEIDDNFSMWGGSSWAPST